MANPPEDSNDQLADGERPTVRIPKYMSNDEVVSWSEVDAEWWEHVQTARRVHEQVVAGYADSPGVVYIERSRGDSDIAGYATTVITILVEEDAPALDVPDEIEGIPIRVVVGETSDTTN
jgi:hypothetical protein